MVAESLRRTGLYPLLDWYLSLPVGAGQEATDLPLLSHLTHVHPQLSSSSVARAVDFRDVVGVIDILSKRETIKKDDHVEKTPRSAVQCSAVVSE